MTCGKSTARCDWLFGLNQTDIKQQLTCKWLYEVKQVG